MAKIIAITNQKGGVGKTTTSTALASGLNTLGYKALLIDADPQANSSVVYNAELDDAATLYEVFTGSPIIKSIQKTEQGDIVAGDLGLSEADMEFVKLGRENILKRALQPIANLYDFIIIDTPPALGIMTLNALTAANTIVIPMFADELSLRGIAQLSQTVKAVRENSNPDLTIDGILLTCYDKRTVLSRDIKNVIEEVAKMLETKVFETTIRESISLNESQSKHCSIFTYAPKSTTATDYREFIKEYVGKGDMACV